MKIGYNGYAITQGMVDAEIARTEVAQKAMQRNMPTMYVIGLNASTNMFA